MKLNGLFIILSFVVSVGLVILSDLPLNDMLGEHPLQSELVFVEGHVEAAKAERLNRNDPQLATQKKGLSEEEFNQLLTTLGAIGAILLLSLVVWNIYRGVSWSRAKSENDFSKLSASLNRYSFVGGMFMGAFFLMTLGGIYYSEGHRGLKSISHDVEKVILNKKQNTLISPQGKKKNDLLMKIHQMDKDRKLKGLFLLSFGILVLISSGMMTHFRSKSAH
jgi:hypothetical protein